jgi:hypothetical protein
MKQLNFLTKLILRILLFGSINMSNAFSLKSFISTRFKSLKKFFYIKWPKDAALGDQEGLDAKRPIMTIWIHGTTKNSILGLIKKDGPKGLFKMGEIEDSVKSKKVAACLSEKAQEEFPAESFYLFRWSGKLSYKNREHEAERLYQALEQEVKLYQERYGATPFIKIITHSHGGNVALNLAKVRAADVNFCIDELVLLACPVQKTTAHLVKDSFFKKIYALYSTHDFVQVLAPQGLGFSGRHFPEHTTLRQAKVKINGKSPNHFDFVNPKFIQHLPGIISYLSKQKTGESLEFNG